MKLIGEDVDECTPASVSCYLVMSLINMATTCLPSASPLESMCTPIDRRQVAIDGRCGIAGR